MDINELIARHEILAMLNRYARGADRRDWSLVRACYHADAFDDHGLYQGGVEGLMAFLAATAARFISTTHLLGNHLAEVDGSQARCETGCLAWYRRLDRHGELRTIAQALRYLDQVEHRDGRWAIVRRLVVLDWEQVFAAAPSAPMAASWQTGGHGEADPSHRFFAESRSTLIPLTPPTQETSP